MDCGELWRDVDWFIVKGCGELCWAVVRNRLWRVVKGCRRLTYDGGLWRVDEVEVGVECQHEGGTGRVAHQAVKQMSRHGLVACLRLP